MDREGPHLEATDSAPEIRAIVKISRLDLRSAVDSLTRVSRRGGPRLLGYSYLRANEALLNVLGLEKEGEEAILYNGGLPSVFWDELDEARKCFYEALDRLEGEATQRAAAEPDNDPAGNRAGPAPRAKPGR